MPAIPKASGKGSFYIVRIDIILLFGMTELQAQVAWKENVSRLHMLSNLTDIGLIVRVVLGNRETVSFNRENVSYLNCPNSSFLHIFTGVQLRLFMILIRQMMTLENCHHDTQPFYTFVFWAADDTRPRTNEPMHTHLTTFFA